jgi:hypothetical protein
MRAALILVAVVVAIAAAITFEVLPATGSDPAHTAIAAASASVTQSAEYRRALALGVRAYVYGYPLLDTDRVFLTSTSVNVPNGLGMGPVNEFSHIRRLADPGETLVVAPNHDTLYSEAWLDLRDQPVVVHMPTALTRFANFELLDPYTNNFASIGAAGLPPGDYAIVPRGWHGRLPRGVKQIRSRYTRVWIIGRTYIKNAADTPNVVRLQNTYSITPLDRWGSAYKPPQPRHVQRHIHLYAVPGTQPGDSPLAFFNALGEQLKLFPPPAADRPLLKQLAEVGIGPAMYPGSSRRIDAATRKGLTDAVAAGAKQIRADLQQTFAASARAHDGWLVAGAGTYGTDYGKRAVADLVGLGAPVPSVAIYPFAVTDSHFHLLVGTSRYVAHFAARDLPFPVKAFWSMTMYNGAGFFVPNKAGIYAINNLTNLRYNADGSLDVYVQASAPRDPSQRQNWLPAPADSLFRLMIRLYEPSDTAGILSGRTWQPPTVLPCLPSGATAAGTRCAS